MILKISRRKTSRLFLICGDHLSWRIQDNSSINQALRGERLSRAFTVSIIQQGFLPPSFFQASTAAYNLSEARSCTKIVSIISLRDGA